MKVLFLTNNINTQPLIDWLHNSAKEDVVVWDKKLTQADIEEVKPDFIISYNYKFILKKEILELLPNKIINLHISLLPYNRGSNPNIWSFLEDTPKGVTIHHVDTGIDTGDILLQKEITFNEEQETLATTYNKLNNEIQKLFIENWDAIINQRLVPKAQPSGYSAHNMKKFEAIKNLIGNDGWNIKIGALKIKYKKLQNRLL